MMEEMCAPYLDNLLKTPKVSAITCYYTPNESFPYNDLDTLVGNYLEEALSSGSIVPRDKLTKKHTQLKLPLPVNIDVDSKSYHVVFRVRYQTYIKNSIKHSNFSNQMCFFFLTDDGKSKCFKIFRNGVVHVTGFTNIDEMDFATGEVINKMATFAKEGGNYKFTWKSVNICMMNVSFKLNRELSLVKLWSTIETQTEWFAMYEPEIYCGLMIDAGTFKACVFRTGSVILTAVKSMQEITIAFDKLIRFLLKTSW